MKRVVVRYRVKPEKLAEHEELVRRVFEELELLRPSGLSYQAIKLGDGTNFIHLAEVATPDGVNPLTTLKSFKEFVGSIGERVEEEVTSSPATLVGAFKGDAPAIGV